MKGTLIKTQQGWMVQYSVINSIRSLPLHPESKVSETLGLQCFYNGHAEVEFEIVHLSTDPLGRDVKPYAKTCR